MLRWNPWAILNPCSPVIALFACWWDSYITIAVPQSLWSSTFTSPEYWLKSSLTMSESIESSGRFSTNKDKTPCYSSDSSLSLDDPSSSFFISINSRFIPSLHQSLSSSILTRWFFRYFSLISAVYVPCYCIMMWEVCLANWISSLKSKNIIPFTSSIAVLAEARSSKTTKACPFIF